MDKKQIEKFINFKSNQRKRIINKGAGSLYNSWRSKVYTKKGKKAGFQKEWKTFEGFILNNPEGWKHGLILIRYDTTKPYTKENCFWGTKGQETIHKCKKLTFRGETKFLFEWCDQFELSYNGAKQRMNKGKNYTAKEVLFGKKKKKHRKLLNAKDLEGYDLRAKASKMINQYKNSDNRKGLKGYDLSIEYMIEQFKKECIYCGTNDYIGLDRVDNKKGHTKNNCVPCCKTCNVTRNNNFSYDEMLILGETIKKINENRRLQKSKR